MAGVARYGGCPIPDTDKDGINDEEDQCVKVPGVARYQGCPPPDTDKDGINDEQDRCPNQFGLARYQGCPIPDTDGDGVNDEEDQCVNSKGPEDNMGCPLVSEDLKKKASTAAKTVKYVNGTAKLQSTSAKGLNDMVLLLKQNPALSIAVDVHTDDAGDDEKNMLLSQQQADAVKNYLVSKGVEESRIRAMGHGETMPVADNKTAAGRTANRRTELTLSYFK